MHRNPQLIGSQSGYLPPAFAHLPAEEVPHTLCASCPESVWFQKEQWQCFCNVMKEKTYSNLEDAMQVRRCDGREIALEKMRNAP